MQLTGKKLLEELLTERTGDVADWDDDSPRLRANLNKALRRLADCARNRKSPSLDEIKAWHKQTLDGLAVPHPSTAGNFRGIKGDPYLETYDVRVGKYSGIRAPYVDAAARNFEKKLQRRVAKLDGDIPAGSSPSTESQLDEIIELAAWAHAKWARIHPFANGNGRTARMLADFILIRYGVPPFVTLRPRPEGDYGEAAEAAMRGRVSPTIEAFKRLYEKWSP